LALHQGALNILLIDAEGPDDGNLLQNLKNRRDWVIPRKIMVREDQIHFMVQIMEAWFVADREALQNYYGPGFRPKSLPRSRQVERVPKERVIQCLKRATERSKKGAYHKTRHAPYILTKVDPGKVRAAAPACERLFSTLEQKIGGR
jgi:hypothetical protein